jgi:hypothetical protein
MSGYGNPGAPDDVYTRGAPLPQTDDPELKAAIDAYVAAHPGVSRAQALNEILRQHPHTDYVEAQQAKRDQMAAKALIESLASMDFDNPDVGWINDQIEEFSKFIISGDEGDDGIEVRKQAA